MKFTFNKKDKLKSLKVIEKLFLEGKSISAYPLRMIYLKMEHADGVKIKSAVSVSKRNFKKAVTRNRIKRLLREAYRLNKQSYFNNIPTSYALMILYLGKDEPDFELVNTKLKLLLSNFIDKALVDKI